MYYSTLILDIVRADYIFALILLLLIPIFLLQKVVRAYFLYIVYFIAIMQVYIL